MIPVICMTAKEKGRKSAKAALSEKNPPLLGAFSFKDHMVHVVPAPLHVLIGAGDEVVDYIKASAKECQNKSDTEKINAHLNSMKNSSPLGYGLAQKHGFNGKEVERLISEENVRKLIDKFPHDNKEMFDRFERDVVEICACMRKLYKHLLSKDVYDEKMIDEFEKDLRDMRNKMFRIKKRMTPKLHILFHHILPFMRKWRNLGFFSETAMESFHVLLKKKIGLYRNAAQKVNVMLKNVLINLIVENCAEVQSYLVYPEYRRCAKCSLRYDESVEKKDDVINAPYCTCEDAMLEDLTVSIMMASRIEDEEELYVAGSNNPVFDSQQPDEEEENEEREREEKQEMSDIQEEAIIEEIEPATKKSKIEKMSKKDQEEEEDDDDDDNDDDDDSASKSDRDKAIKRFLKKERKEEKKNGYVSEESDESDFEEELEQEKTQQVTMEEC